jgi:hypothetical protein
MKQRKILFLALLLLVTTCIVLLYIHSVNKKRYPAFEEYIDTSVKVGDAAKASIIHGDTVITCNFSSVKDTVDLYLSSLLGTIDVVQLENNPDAYFKASSTTVTDSYIGVVPANKAPFLLFAKDGKFISKIGSIGKGPNEYIYLYSEELIEKTDRIYLMPWFSNKILAYNFRGELLPPVRLPYDHGKSVINIEDSIVTVLSLPFDKKSVVAYRQTLQGELIHKVNSAPYAVVPDFSNELISSRNTNAIDLQISKFFGLQSDTLYHYTPGRDLLTPVFTMQFKKDRIPIHNYLELPDYYLTLLMIPVPAHRRTSGVKRIGYIGVNKKTLEAHYVRLINDYLGGVETEFDLIRDKMYVENIQPVLLKEKLDQSKGKIEEGMKRKLSKLLENADDETNNIVIWGKLKE